MALLLVGADARGVLFDEFSENEFLENGKDHCRQQIVDKRAVGGIRRKSDAKNVEARRAPHKAREEQQGIPFYFHR